MIMTVEPSALQELFVGLVNLSMDDRRIAEHAWFKSVAERRPDLVREVQHLWPEGAALTRTGTELIVMGGALGYLGETSAERLLTDLPALPGRLLATRGAYQPPQGVPDMESLLADRFQELTDPHRMAHYAQVVRAVWEETRPIWEAEGLAKVQGECSLFRQQLAEGAHWLDLLHRQHPARMEVFASVMPGWQDVSLSPSFLARGMHFFDLRGRLFVGYAMHFQSLLEGGRKRASEIAVRLKALSDPTRLTLLSYLTAIPASVSDLGKLLEISQPAASEHLKLLRQAGLVHVRREGTKAYYYADAAAIDQLLDMCRSMLTRSQ